MKFWKDVWFHPINKYACFSISSAFTADADREGWDETLFVKEEVDVFYPILMDLFFIKHPFLSGKVIEAMETHGIL